MLIVMKTDEVIYATNGLEESVNAQFEGHVWNGSGTRVLLKSRCPVLLFFQPYQGHLKSSQLGGIFGGIISSRGPSQAYPANLAGYLARF